MKMYFLVYHTEPQSDKDGMDDIGGAYVSCWIEADSIMQADTIARQEIATAQWNILERDDAYEIDEHSYQPNSEALEFYKQALIDKWVLRFHTYPQEE